MVVVVGSPSRRQTFCGFEILKDLQSQEFVSEATVETLRESVLPWTARFNVKCFDFQVGQPLTQRNGEAIRKCVKKGSPYGSDRFVTQASVRLKLKHTLRNRGRPKEV